MDIEILAHKFYDYSRYIKGYSETTIRRYRTIIGLYRRIANVNNIEEVTNDNVRAFFYRGRTEYHWQANSFVTFRMSLMVFFRWCASNGYMVGNPADDIECPKVEKRIPTKLTKQDALKLLEIVYNYPYESKFLRYRNHAIFSTFLFAGLRKSELLGLRYADVDMENLTIFVYKGKGGKDRIIPMSTTLAQSLKRYVDERKRLKKTCPEFFTSYYRNAGFTPTGMKNLMRLVCKNTKIKFSLHKLRHTFATLMLEGGCDIYSLSKMMGHADIKTTTIYLAASAEHLRFQITKHPLNY